MTSARYRALAVIALLSLAGPGGPLACASRAHEEPRIALSPEAQAGAFQLPAPELSGRSPLSLWATYYTIPIVNQRTSGVPLLDRKGRPLGPRVGATDWCRAAMQGSVLIRKKDGGLVTYNFASVDDARQVDCTELYPRHAKIGGTRFKRAKGRYGDGALGWPLVPFRTLAVDPKHLPFGSVIYVPKAKGVRIQPLDGPPFLHDGFFLAGNQGGSVDGAQIDVFIGPAKRNPFDFVKSHRRARFEAYLIEDEEVRRGLRAQHGL